jgi:hypothetical protein
VWATRWWRCLFPAWAACAAEKGPRMRGGRGFTGEGCRCSNLHPSRQRCGSAVRSRFGDCGWCRKKAPGSGAGAELLARLAGCGCRGVSRRRASGLGTRRVRSSFRRVAVSRLIVSDGGLLHPPRAQPCRQVNRAAGVGAEVSSRLCRAMLLRGNVVRRPPTSPRTSSTSHALYDRRSSQRPADSLSRTTRKDSPFSSFARDCLFG